MHPSCRGHHDLQLQRFVWQDQTGPLLAPDPNTDCPTVADVYIMLSNTSLAKAYIGRVESLPYLSRSSIDSIQRWYRLRGARRVIVKLVGEAELVHAEGLGRVSHIGVDGRVQKTR